MIPLPSLSTELDPIRSAIDAAGPDATGHWIHGLAKKELVALWHLAAGRPVARSHLHGPEGQVVVHEGQNSLLMFSRFEKRIAAFEGRVQGYNEQPMAWLTGPGHFTVGGDEAECWFDYTEVPPRAPAGFPPVAPNNRGIAQLVYGGMIDRLRQITDQLVVGAAFRAERSTGDYFLLLRRDRAG